VERWLHSIGGFKSAVATEFSPTLLRKARAMASKAMMNISYLRHDINAEPLPPGPFDLIIVYAAAHHWGRIDWIFTQLSSRLSPGGKLAMWEYTGPHRNQYPSEMWAAAHQANDALPPALRSPMSGNGVGYPHIPTMLAFDPSEAQHSELILQTLRRSFFIHSLRPLGGALAYPLLTMSTKFNSHIHYVHRKVITPLGRLQLDDDTRTRAYGNKPWVEQAVRQLLQADAAWCEQDPEGRSLFTSVIASPRRGGIPNAKYAWGLQRAEMEREEEGTRSKYYTRTQAAREAYPTDPDERWE